MAGQAPEPQERTVAGDASDPVVCVVASSSSVPPVRGAHPARGAPLSGWTESAPYLVERTASVSGLSIPIKFSTHLPLLFPREKESLSSLLEGMPFSEIASKLVFFDLETTGLSHGSGTIAFMAGLATLEGDGNFKVHQIMVTDYPGEAAFLERFAEIAGKNPILVSFNGKAFDSQILVTRFLMNAMKPPFSTSSVLHLDLLYPSRRLWKSELGSCRLSVLEEAILGTPRTDDLPGSEAPDAWFDYVKTGSTERLLKISEHNFLDCVTLARLLFELDRRIENAQGRAALIRALDHRGRKEYAEAALFLESLAQAGDPTAQKLLAIDCEHRLGRLEDALALASALGDKRREDRLKDKMCRE